MGTCDGVSGSVRIESSKEPRKARAIVSHYTYTHIAGTLVWKATRGKTAEGSFRIKGRRCAGTMKKCAGALNRVNELVELVNYEDFSSFFFFASVRVRENGDGEELERRSFEGAFVQLHGS